MEHRALSGSVRLGPEDREAYTFANALRAATLEGRLTAVFCHVPNELAGMVQIVRGKARVPVQVAIARALGLIRGSSDYLFLWGGGSLAMEFKSSTGSLTEGQRDFRTWCEAQGVPFHVVRSTTQGLDLLRAAGRLV